MTRINVAAPWVVRVGDADCERVGNDLELDGCALTGPLLSPDEAAQIAALNPDDSRFRAPECASFRSLLLLCLPHRAAAGTGKLRQPVSSLTLSQADVIEQGCQAVP
jgi:hypothetical protein